MQEKDRMDKQVVKITDVMRKVEELAKKEIKDPQETLIVASALMAVTRNMYVAALGPEDTARMFGAVADSFFVVEDMMRDQIPHGNKPTIH
mgnify:CR=1 FL=1